MQWPVSVGNKSSAPFCFCVLFFCFFVFFEWHVHLITCNEVCQVFWREATLRVPKLLPSPRCAIRHIPFVTRAIPRYNGKFNCAYYYRHLLTKPCHTHAIRRGHLPRRPQSYCQRSYGMHDCLEARQPRGQTIKFMWWGEENDFKNMDLLLV